MEQYFHIPSPFSSIATATDIDDWEHADTYLPSFPDVLLQGEDDPARVFPVYEKMWWSCRTEDEAHEIHDRPNTGSAVQTHYEKVWYCLYFVFMSSPALVPVLRGTSSTSLNDIALIRSHKATRNSP